MPAVDVSQSINHIMKLYLVAGNEKATGGDELVDNDGSSTAYHVRDV